VWSRVDCEGRERRRSIEQNALESSLFCFCHLDAYQSTHCVTADDFSQRFGEIDRKLAEQRLFIRRHSLCPSQGLLQKQQEIYDASQATEVPYYLCIKISTYVNEMSPSPARSNSKSSDDVYGRKDLELEYWFSVPKEKYVLLISRSFAS
jgi:hypothetical protein